MKYLNFEKGTDSQANWLIEESVFDSRFLGKCEANFCQGNGYLGLRSSLEEQYVGETRNMFVNGTFDKFDDNEVTELPNLPDITKMVITINGKRFHMDCGVVKEYSRTMNLKNGEVVRKLQWISPEGDEIHFVFRRFVSMDQEHVIVGAVEITPVNKDIHLVIESGIDGTVSNSGSQHFSEGTKRIYDNCCMEMISETIESGVMAAIHSAHIITADQKPVEAKVLPMIDRRIIKLQYTLELAAKSTLRMEKISTVHTSRDLIYADLDAKAAKEEIKKNSKNTIMEILKKGYETLLDESQEKWDEIWKAQEITVETSQTFDQLALRFAIYHLNIMVKKDDNRVGIGAKALSGEGYKGHSFWDTEVFILPYFIMTEPKTARTLLEYRYKNLYGARIKARENGFEGAMYPWESAWIDDGEVTPLWGAADVVTGETLKILTGLIEQHITADIAYAVWQYYIITGDEDFMDQYGYEMILDTAKFWTSRLEWKEEKNRYEITDVIGPDEYKEHVDNNAYTNYLAYFNMNLAKNLIAELKSGKEKIYHELNRKLDLETVLSKITDMLPKLYLPAPDEKTGIIPQFDGYFDLKTIDLTKYKECSVVGTIYSDYNAEQISSFQVLKQSDLVMLFYLMDDLFDEETKKKNYFYYEERTLHDSSLSKSTHSVIANDLKLKDVAYRFFKGASMVDLGEEMKSSNAGIHSASMGGIWQAAILGFGGVRVVGEDLRIAPMLPHEWTKLTYPLTWKNSPLKITVTKNKVTVENFGEPVSILLGVDKVTLTKGCVKEHTIHMDVVI